MSATIVDRPRFLSQPISKNGHNDERFRLTDSFIYNYLGNKPNFGYNGLGEFVFYRTYSRIKPDGTKESFLDTIRRVVEGCYEIQRKYCAMMHIPWTRSKAQASAQEMFRRIWDFKFLPPGRGLWAMGTEFMWERGSACLNNCFAGETKIITRSGIKCIKDVVDTEQIVLAPNGKWAVAKIKSFGEQPLCKIVFRRGRHRKVVYATPDHRWFVKSKNRALACIGGGDQDKPIYKTRECLTSELMPGMRMAMNFGSGSAGQDRRHWRVDSVEETSRREEVFCAQVPDYHAFTLAGNILTGNCGFISTAGLDKNPSEPFVFVTDMSMLGVGVGFDNCGAGKVKVVKPHNHSTVYAIQDSREGWADSVGVLVSSFTDHPELGYIDFDYSKIRPAGMPINGFGGKASGPEPLADLHQRIIYLFKQVLSRRDTHLTSVDIVDLMNFIGVCVVAGNVRRSSELSLGSPADSNYVSMKDPSRYSYELNSHRWASNNSVFATVGMDYSELSKLVAKNGEPGFVWLDNMRNYGRMIDGRREGIDERVVGTNPCLTGDMQLLTAKGYKTLEDLWIQGGCREYSGGDDVFATYGKLDIINDRGVVPASNVYRTSESAPVFRVLLDNGAHIDATEYHRFIVIDDDNTEHTVLLRDLEPENRIPLNFTNSFGDIDDTDYALVAGWVIGDGSLSPQSNDYIEVMPILRQAMLNTYDRHNSSSDQHPTYEPRKRTQEYFRHLETSISSALLGRLLQEDGVVPGNKHNTPKSIWSGNKLTVAAFLRGLFSADGSVQANESKKNISIRLRQIHNKLLEECQLLLAQFGITSKIYFRSTAGQQLMNDGKGGKKLYAKHPSYDLVVSGRDNVERFINEIGFLQAGKTATAKKWLVDHLGSNNSRPRPFTKVVSITYLNDQPTYCLTEPLTNKIVISTCIVLNCSEQSMESGELCNLCETFPANHDSPDDYYRTLKFAYLYSKTVTLLPTHCQLTNSVLLRNRRIGLSQSGIIQAFQKFGRRKMLTDFCDRGYKEICRWDDVYSDWLCCGRSIKKTSVKPSGSVALLVGATAGIHHTIAPSRSYWRNVRVSSSSKLIQILLDAGYHIERDVHDPKTSVVRFGVSQPDISTVSEISIWEQVKNAADYQKYWADNQVSCTVQFSPDEAPEIGKVLAAFDDALKGISFLPIENHGYAQAPYQATTAAEVEAYNKSLKPLDMASFLNEDAVISKFCDGDTCTIR